METVSVIIPVYNVEGYLEDCLESVCNQSYRNIEIILVDDGSRDNSGVICDDWQEKDSRIHVIHKQNGGLSSARNAGLKEATGDYISFVDSDDLIPTNFIMQLVETLKTCNSEISVCRIDRFWDGNSEETEAFYPFKSGVYPSEEYIHSILLHRVDNASWNKLYKRSAIGELRFKEGIINEDFPFMIALLGKVEKVAYTNETGYLYRRRQGSITQIVKPNIFDFVTNAQDVVGGCDKRWLSAAKAYLYYETVNCIACIVESRGKDLNDIKRKCNLIIRDNFKDFLFNPYSRNKQKFKYMLTRMPVLYRLVYKLMK